MTRTATANAPCWRTERRLAGTSSGLIAGVDEAGRGPWAGPVVAAAVAFSGRNRPGGLNDSKKLTPEQREALYQDILDSAWVACTVIDVGEIDRLNILQATLLAMTNAVTQLSCSPDAILVDGNRLPTLSRHAVAVVNGDSLCPSIAAASIVAKVTRDRLMRSLAETFPGYGWHTNMGYGTRQHARALTEFGVTEHHRRSFAPVRLALAGHAGARLDA